MQNGILQTILRQTVQEAGCQSLCKAVVMLLGPSSVIRPEMVHQVSSKSACRLCAWASGSSRVACLDTHLSLPCRWTDGVQLNRIRAARQTGSNLTKKEMI